MSKILFTQGRNTALDRYFAIGGTPDEPLAMAVDNSLTNFAVGNTTLGSPSNVTAVAFDSVTRSGQTVTVVGTFGTTTANHDHERLSIHNIAFGSVTGTSATVQWGYDQLGVEKNSSTAVTYSTELNG